jgi:hypothetical protein
MTIEFLFGGIRQAVYVREQTFARERVRTLRRRREVAPNVSPGWSRRPAREVPGAPLANGSAEER